MKLLFVYNADDGFFNTLGDITHKILSPSTYPCSLCQITYGATGMKKLWRTFIEGLSCEYEFLHRNQFRQTHESREPLPAIFVDRGTGLDTLMTSTELNSCEDLQNLIGHLRTAIQRALSN